VVGGEWDEQLVGAGGHRASQHVAPHRLVDPLPSQQQLSCAGLEVAAPDEPLDGLRLHDVPQVGEARRDRLRAGSHGRDLVLDRGEARPGLRHLGGDGVGVAAGRLELRRLGCGGREADAERQRGHEGGDRPGRAEQAEDANRHATVMSHPGPATPSPELRGFGAPHP